MLEIIKKIGLIEVDEEIVHVNNKAPHLFFF